MLSDDNVRDLENDKNSIGSKEGNSKSSSNCNSTTITLAVLGMNASRAALLLFYVSFHKAGG